MTEEVWKWITGTGEDAAVSNTGKVFSHRGGGLLTPYNAGGVMYVRLWDYGPKINVARTVLTEFIRKPEEGEVAVHINGDKSDNSVDNLKWATRKVLASIANQNRTKTKGYVLSDEVRKRIRDQLRNGKLDTAELATMHGVSVRTIRRIGAE